jgi:diguanylate cyclase (GGDEF)-like protein
VKILLLDEDVFSWVPLQRTLEQEGFDVVRAEDERKAQDLLLKPDGPRIAILNWSGASKDLPSVCREFRFSSRGRDVYLIVLLSRECGDVAMGLDAGADDCLLVPCDVEELKARARLGQRILQIQSELFQKIRHDPLTELPNRTFFVEQLAESVRKSKEQANYQFAVLFLDIDQFKLVNDGLGHLCGDELIRRVAKRLLNAVEIEAAAALTEYPNLRSGRFSGMVARIGGDEFVILLEGIADVDDAIRVSKQVQSLLEPTFPIDGHKVQITASIGISVSGENLTNATEIMRTADAAMYKAKTLGKARYEVSDPASHSAASRRFELEQDLRSALKDNELEIYYQPLLRLTDCRIMSFEALVRWRHPILGMIQPGEFIPIAEETGLILSIGGWMMREACRQMHEWNIRFSALEPLTVCVNISPKQFEPHNLVDRVRSILQETGLNPQNLDLEVTENLTMQDAVNAATILRNLADLGVSLSLDDFGTGYSSLSYLTKFPIRTLKIDRSFIAEIEHSSESSAIVNTIIVLGHNLGMKVVAEGVETTAQMEILRRFRSDLAQGYLFSRPVPAQQIPAMLIARNKGETLVLQRKVFGRNESAA